MGDTPNATETADGKEKPAQGDADVVFPPFPEPTQDDFEEDISSEERDYYKEKFTDLNTIKNLRLHCTACDRHLGCSAKNESRMRIHPMLRTLVCQTCLTFYNSGEFDKGDDGSELYCRWCGQGGQVYCCADCPHVFCARCVKRNLGPQKIKEIEDLDDWKCFKCNPRCLWDLRATCWALLRYCDQKNQITYKTQDPELKEKYQKSCIQDYTECCRRKSKAKDSTVVKKESTRLKQASDSATKTIPTIQVKKFASMPAEENNKEEKKKAQKRPASPRVQPVSRIYTIKNPIPIAQKPAPPHIVGFSKKIKVTPTSPIRITMEKKSIQTYSPRQPRNKGPVMPFNGFGNYALTTNDNINLSLESLTQGLDMSAVASMASGGQDDDVVCTPDFPMEPLCEMTEDNGDDDVECITPAPAASAVKCPPLLSRSVTVLPDLTPGNIIQMTDNDVTVNATTGGLKFRVDPQTLSSNKMYRLPDGRIFAINANPNMPGGYSATIVAVTDNVSSKAPPKGATYAAKLSAVMPPTTNKNVRTVRRNPRKSTHAKSTSTPQQAKPAKKPDKRPARPCDLNIPVEWYRFNLIDAVDALDYSLSRLNQLKNQATTMFLRTRTVTEMRNLHKTLDRALATSANRFLEIKDNLNKEFKNYINKKNNSVVTDDDDDDDDDVEILPDTNDDPIFIDENSEDSQISSREVDLTAQASSGHDSSGKSEKIMVHDDCVQLDTDKDEREPAADPLMIEEKEDTIRSKSVENNGEHEKRNTDKDDSVSNIETIVDSDINEISENSINTSNTETDSRANEPLGNGLNDKAEDNVDDKDFKVENKKERDLKESNKVNNDKSDIVDNIIEVNEKVKSKETHGDDLEDVEMTEAAAENSEKDVDDNEMSEKAIEELLRDDNESMDGSVNNHSVEISNEKTIESQ